MQITIACFTGKRNVNLLFSVFEYQQTICESEIHFSILIDRNCTKLMNRSHGITDLYFL